MDSAGFLSFLPPPVRQHLIPIVFGVLGVLLIIVGIVPVVFPAQKEPDIVFEQGGEHEASVAGAATSSPEGEMIQVDIAGAIVKPGVYKLSPDSRVQDVVNAAGGFSENANAEWIAKNLNLAAKLSDAVKVYVPFEGEAPLRQGFEGEGGTGLSGQESQESGLVNINRSTQSQLEALPGIGPVTAQKIIAGRPYTSVDDLLSKKVLGQSVFGKIKEQVSVN